MLVIERGNFLVAKRSIGLVVNPDRLTECSRNRFSRSFADGDSEDSEKGSLLATDAISKVQILVSEI